jgi:DNA-binding CsgD family transcriptional regulator
MEQPLAVIAHTTRGGPKSDHSARASAPTRSQSRPGQSGWPFRGDDLSFNLEAVMRTHGSSDDVLERLGCTLTPCGIELPPKAGAGVMAERLATKEAIVRCMSKPIIYQKRQFPTHAALAEHLAPRLGRSVKAVRSALNRYNGDVKRVIAHGDNAIPIIHQGQHFPSRTALAKHLAPLLGKSVAALKATLHRCNGDVRRVVDLASRPISARKRNRVIVERLAAGATLQTIADEFGLTRQRVSRINIDLTGERLQIQPDPWPAKRTARLRAMLDQGLRPAQIAPRLGVSRNAVYGKIHRLRRR